MMCDHKHVEYLLCVNNLLVYIVNKLNNNLTKATTAIARGGGGEREKQFNYY